MQDELAATDSWSASHMYPEAECFGLNVRSGSSLKLCIQL